jgi:hypothetical protein
MAKMYGNHSNHHFIERIGYLKPNTKYRDFQKKLKRAGYTFVEDYPGHEGTDRWVYIWQCTADLKVVVNTYNDDYSVWTDTFRR